MRPVVRVIRIRREFARESHHQVVHLVIRSCTNYNLQQYLWIQSLNLITFSYVISRFHVSANIGDDCDGIWVRLKLYAILLLLVVLVIVLEVG